MTAIVSVETVLLVILVVLVAGLLRSHAEILRRLGADGSGADGSGAGGAAARADLPAAGAPQRPPGAPAAPIAGATPGGDAVALDLSAPGPPTLLAFLSSGCTTCAGFWAGLHAARLPAGVQPVVVTRDSDREQPARLRELAPSGVPVLMSSQAWEDYAVPGSPYFVLVDGAIRGEGVATSWPALSSLVGDAIADRDGAPNAGAPSAGAPSAGVTGGTARALTVERTLAGAGIGPDHPSLYPADRPDA
jgi:hypothetical protein